VSVYATYEHVLLVLACCGLAATGLLMFAVGTDRFWTFLRSRLGRVDTWVGIAAVCLATMYGGSKPVDVTDRTEADAGIEVAYVTIDVTNIVDSATSETTTATRVEIGYTAGDVTESTPFWGKMGLTNDWTAIERTGVDIRSDVAPGGTNVVSFWTSGALGWNYYWFGFDPPKVITDDATITITEFTVTSKKVTIGWLCDNANFTTFSVYAKKETEATWHEIGAVDAVAAGSTNVFERSGFTVDVTTSYRIRGEYREE
jgi:hypothetical protein